MFALGIRYLNGWAMATHPSDRERAEWPPHPDRVFMALVAAHFETEGGAEERAALEWLQSLPAPAMAVGDHEQREIVTSYVPVNDTEIARPKNDTQAALAKRIAARESASDLDDAKGKGLALLPEFRSRQSRSFPVAIPHVPDDAADGMPRVHLIWDAEIPGRHQNALASLSAKVTSIGHSASLAQVWVEPKPPPVTLVPVDGVAGGGGAKHRLRVSGDSRLEHLESRYKAGLRPSAALWQGYGDPPGKNESDKSRADSVFDPNLLILRRLEGPRLGLESTLQLTEALRGVIMSRCSVQPPPEWISGHAPSPDGKRSEEPHIAFIPLADVGHEHARGHLLGVAIVVPRGVSDEEQRCLAPLLFDSETGEVTEIELKMGGAGVWRVMQDEVYSRDDDDYRKALDANTWTALALGPKNKIDPCCWATVTPIVFDRHPKDPKKTWTADDPPAVRAEKQATYWTEAKQYWEDVESMIAEACMRIGLPRPIEVVARPASHFVGVPASGHMPRMLRKDRTKKRQTHAVIRFDTPVVGPVLLGAGRYRGYGLCRPLPRDRSDEGGEA